MAIGLSNDGKRVFNKACTTVWSQGLLDCLLLLATAAAYCCC